MNLTDLEHILEKKMKLGKACDYYQLTVEHLRFCGGAAKICILRLLNNIIENIYYLTCPQVKVGLGSTLHKGKGKPVTRSNSYRRITVTPCLGSILDRHIDPIAEKIFRKVQSPDQLGFTANISYLMAAVQRGECQRHALDTHQTCFGVSLDGEAAFPSVERQIQIRELYSVGERGDILEYSKNTYSNTECYMKKDGYLSRCIREYKGNRQGHVRASGHYKAYINPCLTSLNSSSLGFNIGPICITAVSVADDTYLISGSKSGLQGALNIINFFGKRYRVVFNADKTKLVVTGPRADMNYYRDIQPWTLDGKKISVVDENEHLGLLVAGENEEQRNIDANIQDCRRSLLGLLGSAYAYKCQLPPTVQIHLWRTYNLPILRSGLASLPIRPVNLGSLNIFYNKILRSFLKLSNRSPIPALYFLFGELPMEAKLHLDLLSLFYTIWSNPSTTIHRIVQYLLKMTDNKSLTWSAHLRNLCLKYNLPDPLKLLESNDVWPKTKWITEIKTKITIYHEKELRQQAALNSKMVYLNVQLQGLSGCPHPVLQNINNMQEVKKLRIHLKFLTGDFLTAERLAKDTGSDPRCKLCPSPEESTNHVLTQCKATQDIKNRLLPELLNVIALVQPSCTLLLSPQPKYLTQFLLDCTSPNLPCSIRIPSHNPRVAEVFQVSRNWCYGIGRARARLLANKTAYYSL